jgi:hypothetical protein
MRRELRKECDLATCSYGVDAGASLKIRDGAKFKVAAYSKDVSYTCLLHFIACTASL